MAPLLSRARIETIVPMPPAADDGLAQATDALRQMVPKCAHAGQRASRKETDIGA